MPGMMLIEAYAGCELETWARGVNDFLMRLFLAILGTNVDPPRGNHRRGRRGSSCRNAAPEVWIIGTDESRAGDVGVVVASVGAGIGAVSNDMFAVVVFIGVTTTLAAPLVIV